MLHNMKNRLFVFILLFTLCVMQTSWGVEVDELNGYFEIRDTIALMNSEMEKGLKEGRESLLFDEKDIDLKIESFVGFMKNRISAYAVSDSKLRFHYVKKLDLLIEETQRLFALAKPVIALKRRERQAKVDKVITPIPFTRVTHPYFDSIDFRTLASREPLSEEPKEILSAAVMPISIDEFDSLEEKKRTNEVKIDETARKVAASPKKTERGLVKETNKKGKPAEKAAEVIDESKVKAVAPQIAVDEDKNVTEGDFMRPMAIMVENFKRARPQSGLYSAELLYEMPVEGGITRFMGVYSKAPSLVGPIRSCREYFVDRALESDALYVHCGGSPMGYAYLAKSKIKSIDEIKNSSPFFRDKVRKAPHNLYAKGENIYKYMAKFCNMRVAAEPVLLSYGERNKQGEGSGDYLKINYNWDYTVVCKYENGVYHRFMNNILHLDRENKKPLSASAIIVQIANMKVADKVGRLKIDLVGSGSACIYENGYRTDVKWIKSDPYARTLYYDESGKEYLFEKKGAVWIFVVSPEHKVIFEQKNKSEKSSKTGDEKSKVIQKAGNKK